MIRPGATRVRAGFDQGATSGGQRVRPYKRRVRTAGATCGAPCRGSVPSGSSTSSKRGGPCRTPRSPIAPPSCSAGRPHALRPARDRPARRRHRAVRRRATGDSLREGAQRHDRQRDGDRQQHQVDDRAQGRLLDAPVQPLGLRRRRRLRLPLAGRRLPATPTPQNPCIRANNLSRGLAFEFNASVGDVVGLDHGRHRRRHEEAVHDERHRRRDRPERRPRRQPRRGRHRGYRARQDRPRRRHRRRPRLRRPGPALRADRLRSSVLDSRASSLPAPSSTPPSPRRLRRHLCRRPHEVRALLH